MSTAGRYTALLAAVAAERLVELVISRRHLRWALERGGSESGQGHFPAMVALHTGLLLGSAAEVRWGRRRFRPAVGWPALAVALACQAGRYWCIATLGKQWNTRVVVVPGLGAVERGPYRWLRHPNYVVVAAEGVALPLVHGAVVTSAVFTALDAVLLLRYRIPAEERALAALAPR